MKTKLTLLDKWRLFRLWQKLRKDKTMLEKLKSRKLWITVLTGALTPILVTLGVDQELIEKVLLLAMTYIGGESVIDASRAFKQNEDAS